MHQWLKISPVLMSLPLKTLEILRQTEKLVTSMCPHTSLLWQSQHTGVAQGVHRLRKFSLLWLQSLNSASGKIRTHYINPTRGKQGKLRTYSVSFPPSLLKIQVPHRLLSSDATRKASLSQRGSFPVREQNGKWRQKLHAARYDYQTRRVGEDSLWSS